MSSASRRPSLPGADELFRSTGPAVVTVAAPELEISERPTAVVAPTPTPTPRTTRSVQSISGDRSPTGREKHDKKITVYLSPEELVHLERARLTLAAEHGLYIDRGRIVREALAVVLADLEDKSGASILVRRLHGGAAPRA